LYEGSSKITNQSLT